MQIIRNALDTAAGPENWFTGEVYIDPIATPGDASSVAWGRHVDEYSG